MDPMLPTLVAATFVILLVGTVLRRMKQPHVLAYLVVGVLIGPHGLRLFTDELAMARLGEVGVVLLLFFVGMEVSFPRLASGWRISLIGTLLQIAGSLGVVTLLGLWLDWSTARIVLLGFAISLSSTAVVISLLRAWNQLDSERGQDALGILLIQDVALIPMLIVLGMLGGDMPSPAEWGLQLVGAAGLMGLLWVVARRSVITLPFSRLLKGDAEFQVFSAFLVCFGFAFITALLGLSTALGAFVAGVVVTAARETEWVHRSLEPYRVLLVALFFVSIGMLIDLDFLTGHWELVGILVLATLVTNTAINACILRWLGRSWSTSLFLGSLLAPIGEFSFVLAAVGRQTGIITDFSYQAVLGVISITLVLSPAWIALAEVALKPRAFRRQT